jgi:hypothetical protein
MRHDLTALLYDAPAEAALEAVRTHPGPMLIDLDETLYLRNFNQRLLRRGRYRTRSPALAGDGSCGIAQQARSLRGKVRKPYPGREMPLDLRRYGMRCNVPTPA